VRFGISSNSLSQNLKKVSDEGYELQQLSVANHLQTINKEDKVNDHTSKTRFSESLRKCFCICYKKATAQHFATPDRTGGFVNAVANTLYDRSD
jgi:hypothetical protein